MDKLKETWNQIRDLYAGMPPGTRVVAVLLTAVLLVSLVFLVLPGTRAPSAPKDVFLYGDYEFTRPEQVLVDDALGSAGLKDHTWQGYRLKVPAKKSELYISALSKAKAVPQDATAIILQNARDTSVLTTKEDRNSREFAAMLVAVSQNIRRMPGIEDATVLGNSTFVLKNMKWERVRTANVTVRPYSNRELDKNMRAAILGIVKNSLGITDAGNITIIDEITKKTWTGSEGWFTGSDGGLLEKKRDEELAFEQKILLHLSDIDDLKVSATAIVDSYSMLKQFGVDLGKPVEGISDSYNLKIDAQGNWWGSRPGYEMQNVNSPLPYRNALMNEGLKYNEKQSRDRVGNVMQGKEYNKEYAPFPLLGIAASVRVPYAYFMKTWQQSQKRQGNDAAEPQEGEIDNWITQEITRLKKQLYPHLRMQNPQIIDDAELDKLIEIYPYNTQEIVPLPELTAWQNLMAWFGDNWKTMGLFGLVAASLGVLWSATRPQKPEPIIIYEAPEMPEVDFGTDDEDEEDEEGGSKRSLEPFNKSMRSLQEEVSELVVENPDAAASVLRQWIGRVEPQEQK